VQTLQAQSYSELASRIRFTIKYKGKALLAYFVFFIITYLLLIALLYFLDWVKDHPFQYHWEYFVLSLLYALAFAFPIQKGNFKRVSIPFAFEKYFIDPALAQDLKKLEYIKATAIITDIKILSKGFLKPQLHALTLKLDESNETIIDTDVHLNLLFQNIYFFSSNDTRFYADTAWIGQKVEVCFLPKSKRIVQLMGLPEQDNFQHLSSEFFDQLRPSKMLILKDIPSHFAQELFAIQEIQAVRQEHHAGQYELIITTIFHNQYHISANSQGFAKLEQILSNRIDFLKYRQFKQNSSIRSEVLYRPKIIKPQQFLNKIMSIPYKAFL
jgi:hypothetical protein